MKLKTPVVDYRKFRFNRLNEPEFSHIKLLLYWPVFGLLFQLLERAYDAPFYYPMHCALDDIIPFCEWFIIPYMFWFIYMVGIHIYTFFYHIDAFKRLMWFIIITYTAALVAYIVFPNCQELRPVAFERDNPLIRFVRGFYQFDTNTNVCPSMHVMGAVSVHCTAMYIERFRTKGWKLFYSISTILICVSTVFLKQHSVLDVFAAIPFCLIAYYLCFHTKAKHNAKDKECFS